MDMGSVLQSYNFGNLESDDADYVGGIAGQSKSITAAAQPSAA